MGKGKKVALLVGVGCYGEGLKPLQCPANGVRELAAILRTPDVGGFDEVVALEDPDVGTFRARMGEVFSSLRKDDLALFYFTGHGIKDMTGEFYLTSSQSRLLSNGDINRGTAVEGTFIKGELQRCSAQQKVVILDCCLGAAFAKGFLTMDDGQVDLQANLGGEGWVVLTAATARNYALEQEGEPLSVYTRYLVEGLKTGAAAPDGQTHITVGQLHAYVQGKVKIAAPTMEPAIFNALAGREIPLAKAAVGNPELRLRKAAERYIDIDRAEITPVGLRYLRKLATELGIAPERMQVIANEILRPHRERRDNLREYEAAYREAVDHYQGLPARAQQELKDLQRLLNLRDGDVTPIQARVPLPAPKPPTPKNPQPPASRPEPKPPQPSPYTPRVNRKQFLTWAGFGGGGLALAVSVRPLSRLLSPAPSPSPAPTPEPTPSPEPTPAPTATAAPTPATLSTSEFEVVTVNETGDIAERQTTQAEYFAEDLGNGVTLEMVAIPGGEFTMGAPETEADSRDDERPQRQVTIAPFFMGQYVVTQAQYQAVMGQNPSNFTENGADRPVEQVSWEDAVAFCEALSEQTGRIYRLPSEAEWEYACRAGTESPFYFGPTITTELANYRGQDWELEGVTYPGNYGQGPKGTFREETTAVGSFPPNGFGLYDMHGNVWEWCEDDWHSSYQGAPSNDSAWVEADRSETSRLLRGGSWLNNPRICRSANRDGVARDGQYGDVGFRVVCASSWAVS
ncbi:MAG: SUMF1/EgtB/PvdO family nonheme iron enzyme [Cyanobacteria bacterium]|nr:SUMF1/EgtB/PvdO family nonheme iron enzyme [Cyanobacteriota bacterium]